MSASPSKSSLEKRARSGPVAQFIRRQSGFNLGDCPIRRGCG
jgi:hypothetical protein